MNGFAACLAVLAVLATSAHAMEVAEIGTIEADFDGEVIALPTVSASDGQEVSSTAYLHLVGGGFSSLSLTGLGRDNARLDISVLFHSAMPDAETPPVDVEISYAPKGTAQRWTTSFEAMGTGPNTVDFTILRFEGDQGHVTGTFSGLLCYTESYDGDPDVNNCRPIQGSFDTPIEIER